MHRLYGPERNTKKRQSPRQATAKVTSPPTSLTDQVRRFRIQVETSRLASLAADLGVRPDALQAIGIGWASRAELHGLGAAWQGEWPDGAWVFPEFNGDGQVCGFSLRAPDGRKSAPSSSKTGAHRGLVVPVDAELRPALSEGIDLVVAGASDVARGWVLGRIP